MDLNWYSYLHGPELGLQNDGTLVLSLLRMVPRTLCLPGMLSTDKGTVPALELYLLILLVNLLSMYLNLEPRPHYVTQPGLTILLTQPLGY